MPSKAPSPSCLILPETSVESTDLLRSMFSRGNSFVLHIPNTVAPSRIPWSITGADLYNIATSNMISNIALDGILSLLLPASLSPRIHCYPTDFFTHLALTAFGYSPDAGTRYTIFRPLLRPGAHLSLIPVSHALHFTLLLIDHHQHKLKGYDSLFGPPNQESTILSHLRILKQFLTDEATRLQFPESPDWEICPRAAADEFLPRQINGIDCGIYVAMMALCLTASAPIPISYLTPPTITSSRMFLATGLVSMSFPPASSLFSPAILHTAASLSPPHPPSPAAEDSNSSSSSPPAPQQPSKKRRMEVDNPLSPTS